MTTPNTSDGRAGLTAGPWSVVHPGPLIDSLRIFGPDSQYIASVGNSDDTPEQTAANARLIAAAPELFEALEGALTVLEAHGGVTRTRESREAASKARAALTKATQPRP